jgi:hypothetical protein
VEVRTNRILHHVEHLLSIPCERPQDSMLSGPQAVSKHAACRIERRSCPDCASARRILRYTASRLPFGKLRARLRMLSLVA